MSRQRWTIRLPDNLPEVAGMLTILIGGTLFLAPFVMEMIVGRPGSTIGVALVYGPDGTIDAYECTGG